MNIPPPDVAILIVSWNTRELLAECLEAVGKNSKSLTVHTVVVDNASADGSADMVCTCFPQVQMLALTENLGFVGGNNLAYKELEATPRYVLLLNPDAVLEPEALVRMVAWMDAHAEAGACGPLTLYPDRTLQPSWTRFPTFWSELSGRHDRRFRGRSGRRGWTIDHLRRLLDAPSVDWVSGACLMIRNSTLAQDLHGVLFDPDFHMYSEETDLCYRLHQAGWKTFFLPQAEVVHHYGKSSQQAQARTLYLLYQSKFLFVRKHYGTGCEWRLRAGIALTSGLKWSVFALLGGLPSPRRAVLRTQRDRQRAVLQALQIRSVSAVRA